MPLDQQQVALNAPAAQADLVDLALQLTRVLQLVGWGGLGAYLLIRAGFALRTVGLDGRRPGRDALGAAALAALIGIPGLGVYLGARALGVSVTIAPTTLDDTWWRLPVLVASAAANAWAEELVMVGYLLTRLRQLGWSENRALGAAGPAPRVVPPLPGPRRFHGKHRDGAGLRPGVAAGQPAVDAGRGAHADRRRGVPRVRRAARPGGRGCP